jgi:alanine racemase
MSTPSSAVHRDSIKPYEQITHSVLPHNSWLEVNAQAIAHNIALYKSVAPQSLLAPVIKSNAYGHGIELIAKLCQALPTVDALCVVSVSEALSVRACGVTKPLVVLSILDNDLERAIMLDIQLVVYDLQTALHLNVLAERLQKNVFVHIKIDTGLSRLGFLWNHAIEIIEQIAQLPFVSIQGIFSHLAEAESLDQTFTNLQYDRFNIVLSQCKQRNIIIPWEHTSCSAAATANDKSHLSFVRLGIGAYGLWPSQENKVMTQALYPSFSLQPALTWKSRIIQIKQLPAQSFIGYDRTHQLEKDSIIAVLPVGYWDGYDRGLSNKGHVMINGRLAPIVGRVAMNLMMVDVTNVLAHVGQEVTLLGGELSVSAESLAALCNTINYEIITRINPLLPRMIV